MLLRTVAASGQTALFTATAASAVSRSAAAAVASHHAAAFAASGAPRLTRAVRAFHSITRTDAPATAPNTAAQPAAAATPSAPAASAAEPSEPRSSSLGTANWSLLTREERSEERRLSRRRSALTPAEQERHQALLAKAHFRTLTAEEKADRAARRLDPAALTGPQYALENLSRREKKADKAEHPSLTVNPPIAPATASGVSVAAQGGIPKQKVAMYTKILRVLRSPVKGAVASTSGDDYVLDADEAKPSLMIPGLIAANLTPAAKNKKNKKSGKDTGRSYGKGGRKSARAHVWIQKAVTKGTGDMYVNGVRYCEFFTELDHRWELCAPFYYTNTLTDFDMIAVVHGGGKSGQAGAIKHAAAKALQAYDRQRYRPMLKRKFLLTRDARVVERKKYGQKKARKSFTFVKR